MARAALDILPRSAVASFTLAHCYDRLGCESEAVMQCHRCEDLMPYLRIRRWPAILSAIYKGRAKWVRPGLLGAAKLLETPPRAPSAMLADLFIRLGEHGRGIRWMQRAFRERGLRALYLKVDPAFDSIRSSPECAELVRHLESRNVELSQTVVA